MITTYHGIFRMGLRQSGKLSSCPGLMDETFDVPLILFVTPHPTQLPTYSYFVLAQFLIEYSV